MFDRLDVKVSDNYNALYGRDDLLKVLMCMSDGNRFAASATASLGLASACVGADGADGGRVPSSSWVLKKLRDVDPEHMEKWCRDGTRRLLKAAKIKKMLRRGGMVAVDLTNIAYYGRSLKEETVKAKPKNGTSRFLVHAVAHSIGHGYDVPLESIRVTKEDKMDTILLRILKNLDRAGARPGLLLVDRGFFSVNCINGLKRAGHKFLMPAVKNKRVKKAILEHHGGKRGAASMFHISNSDRKRAGFNLLIVEKEKQDKDAEITDRYVAFATNMPCRTREELIETLPETYRRRWIIETGFRVIKNVLGKTCSNALHVRLFLFHFALLLYNLWLLAKHEDIRRGRYAGGESFTIALFVQRLMSTDKKLIDWEKEHGNYYDA